MSWIVIPLALGSIAFGYVGLAVTAAAVSTIYRRRYAEQIAGSRGPAAAKSLALLSPGVSMLLAGTLIWTHWVLALALGLWPVLAFLCLHKLNYISVTGKHSSTD